MLLGFLLLLAVALYSVGGMTAVNTSDETNLSMWFGDSGRCALTTSHDNCTRKTYDYTFSHRTMALVTHFADGGDNWPTYAGHCCSIEIPLQNRGFLNSTDGLTNAQQKPVMNVLTRLTKTNISTVAFFGDSITAQTYYAFIAELRRECLVHNVSLPDSITEQERKNIPPNPLFPNIIFSVTRWSNVTLLLLQYQNVNLLPEVDTFLLSLEAHYASPVFVVGSAGLHYPREPAAMYKTAEKYVLFMAAVHRRGANVALMTETTATHFNSDDGSFERWETPNGYNYHAYNDWDKENPLYNCRALPGNITNRVQNEVTQKVLVHHNLTREVYVVETFRHLAPHHNMHYGNCHAEGGYRMHNIDCTHFCAFSPLMWTPIWRSLEQSLQKALHSKANKTHGLRAA